MIAGIGKWAEENMPQQLPLFDFGSRIDGRYEGTFSSWRTLDSKIWIRWGQWCEPDKYYSVS